MWCHCAVALYEAIPPDSVRVYCGLSTSRHNPPMSVRIGGKVGNGAWRRPEEPSVRDPRRTAEPASTCWAVKRPCVVWPPPFARIRSPPIRWRRRTIGADAHGQTGPPPGTRTGKWGGKWGGHPVAWLRPTNRPRLFRRANRREVRSSLGSARIRREEEGYGGTSHALVPLVFLAFPHRGRDNRCASHTCN